MKRTRTLSAILFTVAFVLTYFSLCYILPGWRIKLAADAATYFVESIKHMALIKFLISGAVGLVAGIIGYIAVKKES